MIKSKIVYGVKKKNATNCGEFQLHSHYRTTLPIAVFVNMRKRVIEKHVQNIQKERFYHAIELMIK